MTEEERRFHEKIADRLIETREAKGMTQEKLAEKVGLQSNSVHRYEAAERKINFYTAVKMADAQTMVNGAKLTAYENGYAVYEVDGSYTVMAVDRCGDYRYDFTDGTYQVVSAETFEDTEWSVRLLMEGERRMEHNLNKREADAENVALGCDGFD